MSETSDELLRGFQAQEKRFVERRFPLRFAPESPALRELYAESGTLPVPAVLASAIEDAVWPRGGRVTRMPLGPARLLDLLPPDAG